MEQKIKPRNRPKNYGQLIFEEGAKVTKGEKTIFSINDAGTTGQLYDKKIKNLIFFHQN
jgi:hypothetical protein